MWRYTDKGINYLGRYKSRYDYFYNTKENAIQNYIPKGKDKKDYKLLMKKLQSINLFYDTKKKWVYFVDTKANILFFGASLKSVAEEISYIYTTNIRISEYNQDKLYEQMFKYRNGKLKK